MAKTQSKSAKARSKTAKAQGGAPVASWRPLGWAALTGGLLAGAYPGGGLWPLALVAYVPLLWALRDVRRVRRGVVLGLVAGTVVHAVSFHWLTFTMREMSGLPVGVGWAIVGLHAVAMGLHQAAFAGALVASRSWRGRWWWPAWVGAVLVMAEVVVPWQFPWYLGNAVYPSLWLLQAADVIGVVGVSGLAATCSALTLRVLERRTARSVLAVGALLVCWVGYGGVRLWMIDHVPVTKTWKVGVVQHNPSMAEKKSLKPAERMPMLRRIVALTKTLPRDELDLVVWSEGALPFFYVPLEVETPGRAPPVLRNMTKEVHALAAALGRPLLFGSLRMTDVQWKQRARNSAVLIDGKERRYYDKHMLVPFGEFLPGRDWFPALKDLIPGVSDLYEGRGPTLLTVRGVNIGMSICYEALFANFMWRHNAAADLLINLTDDVWFGPTFAPEMHLMVQLARAVELRRPLLRATATGISALVTAQGEIQGRTAVWQATTRVMNVKMRALNSPFRLWGPWPSWILALGVLVGLGWSWRRPGAKGERPTAT